MKTKFLVTAVIVLASTLAMANPGGPRIVVIGQKEATVFKVIYQGESLGKVKLTIVNKNNEVVYEDVRKSNGYIRRVNFAGMEPGEYTIEIADQQGKQSQMVVYGIRPTTLKTVDISKMQDEGKYLLAVSNNGSEQIHVDIFDGEKNLVHSQQMTVKGQLRLIYNLQSVAGIPTFEVTDASGRVRTFVK